MRCFLEYSIVNNAGTLLINGNTADQGSYTVASGATLGGTGTIGLSSGASVTVEGTLAPGNSIGTFTITESGAVTPVTDVVFADGGELLIEVDPTTADLLVVEGNLDLSGIGDMLTIVGTAGAASYDIVAYTGTLTGVFDTASLPAGYTIDYGSGTNSTIALVIPEPGTLALCGLGAGLILLGRKRRGAVPA